VLKLTISSAARNQMVDITAEVNSVVKKSDLQSGTCHLYVPHTTAAVTVNESADAFVAEDILEHLRSLVPADAHYKHREGNSDAHIKASLIGPDVTVPIQDGHLALGTWQGVFFCEFDGPRQRQVWVTLIKET